VILGIWGALIPFVGPYFSYSFGSNATWHYTADRLWLCILPGALAIIAGAFLLAASKRDAGVFGGWLAALAGTWFVVGPAVSLTWEHGQGPIGRPLFGATRQMLELVGYFYGLGALIVALAAFSIGRFLSRPALAEEAAVAGRMAPQAARSLPASAAPAAAPRASGETPAAAAPARGPAQRTRSATAPLGGRPRGRRGLPFGRHERAAREANAESRGRRGLPFGRRERAAREEDAESRSS